MKKTSVLFYAIVYTKDRYCIYLYYYYPPKVYTLFGKKMNEKQRREGEERTEVPNIERKQPIR